MTEHTIKVDETAAEATHGEVPETHGKPGESVNLQGGLDTDDAEEAAWVAERAAIKGLKPTVTTVYDDGEQADRSIHTGARESDFFGEKEAEAAPPPAAPKPAAAPKASKP